MARCSLLIVCLFVVSLQICASGTQLGKYNDDLFEISNPDKYELLDDLKDETIFQANDKLCSSNSDCMYGGNCTSNGTCSCPEGTNGTLCENVIQCMKYPEMCGNGTDVACVFDVKSEYAYCKCNDKKKWYNDFAERCQEPCRKQVNKEIVELSCGLYGRCTNSFCWCIKGVSGDFCQKIDQCEEVDCGDDPSTTCILGIDGAYCKCNKTYQVFDKEEKVCKGKPCRNNTDCMNGGQCTNDGTCSCPRGTDGPLCQDVLGCIKNPNMCGNGTDVQCVYDMFDLASCKCDDSKKHFNKLIGKCAEPCDKYINHQLIREDCGEYGRCSNSFCWCVKGVSGDRCETIDQCASGEVDCSNDPMATCSLGIDGAYCKCNKTYQIFDKKEKMCTGEPCSNDTDCFYGGNCTEDGTCFCRKGVGGPLCQQVYECEKNPDMCGKGTDVKCVFDVSLEKAVCECNNDEEKGFDVIEKKCKKFCYSDDDCGMYGRCDRNSFCRCLEGVSGDNCEIIEKCKRMDCGPRINCTLGSNGEAHCKCPDPHMGFYYEEKTCKACNCGDNSKGCEFVDGKKKCECSLNYLLNGDKCEACNCGELSKGCELRDGKKECFCPLNYTSTGGTCQKCNCGIASYHCKMEDGKTKCICYKPGTNNAKKKVGNSCHTYEWTNRQNKTFYYVCDCGVHGGNCSFTETGEKQCLCKPGFKMAKETGFCTEMCNATKKCQNEGVCQEGLCKCHEDYTGALCETPKWCMNSRCGNGRDEVECIWDRVKKEGRCECKKPYHLYIEDLRECTECDCGPYGRCILTERGEKVCLCKEGYADYLLKCKRCDCGPSSINCTFQKLERKLCQCRENINRRP
ncbi:Tenascin-X like protein [Argiope bruennichi]|uniref:Tenascin-X like protein n=1 Tax=Argiope bruennichi TaxID=94029 RepID=A0A8T0EVB1_ARGBR|nr:Tenascin-X like protein [Argiope bruennichi]